jgi:hypothetical protein
MVHAFACTPWRRVSASGRTETVPPFHHIFREGTINSAALARRYANSNVNAEERLSPELNWPYGHWAFPYQRKRSAPHNRIISAGPYANVINLARTPGVGAAALPTASRR